LSMGCVDIQNRGFSVERGIYVLGLRAQGVMG